METEFYYYVKQREFDGQTSRQVLIELFDNRKEAFDRYYELLEKTGGKTIRRYSELEKARKPVTGLLLAFVVDKMGHVSEYPLIGEDRKTMIASERVERSLLNMPSTKNI